jgi:hypothetical protein
LLAGISTARRDAPEKLAVIDFEDPQPRDAGSLGGARLGRRHVVLHRACDHTRAATVAAVEIDHHAVAGFVWFRFHGVMPDFALYPLN